jgi:hypothetical protein
MVMTYARNLEFDLAKQSCTNYINASPNVINNHKTDYVNGISLLLITVTDTSQVHSLTLLAHAREQGKMKDIRRKYSRLHKEDDIEGKSGISGRAVSVTY